MAREFVHEPDARRYVLRIDGAIVAVVDYAINGEQISFTRTFTNPAFRGKGLAGEIVEFAVNDVQATSDRHILPMCWYVAEWFDKHPERAELLVSAS